MAFLKLVSSDGKTDHASDNYQECEDFLRSYNLVSNPGTGWWTAPNGVFGCIYHEKTPGGRFRAVVWFN